MRNSETSHIKFIELRKQLTVAFTEAMAMMTDPLVYPDS